MDADLVNDIMTQLQELTIRVDELERELAITKYMAERANMFTRPIG